MNVSNQAQNFKSTLNNCRLGQSLTRNTNCQYQNTTLLLFFVSRLLLSLEVICCSLFVALHHNIAQRKGLPKQTSWHTLSTTKLRRQQKKFASNAVFKDGVDQWFATFFKLQTPNLSNLLLRTPHKLTQVDTTRSKATFTRDAFLLSLAKTYLFEDMMGRIYFFQVKISNCTKHYSLLTQKQLNFLDWL